jgi:hypothetical protein
MLGEIGDVRTKLNPAGKVFVRGEFGTLKPTVRSTWVKRLKLWDIKD